MVFYLVAEAIIYLFALIGFVDVLNKIVDHMFAKGKDMVGDVKVVVKLSGEEKNAEYKLWSILKGMEQIKTQKGCPDIYVLEDEALGGEAEKIAELFAADFDCVKVCKKQNIISLFEKDWMKCDIIKDNE